LKRKHKGFRNKDPRYFDKVRDYKKKLWYFFLKESKNKLGKKLK
jgi:hypothetical protein